MIESPLVQQWKAETAHDFLLDVLRARFDRVPRDVSKRLLAINDEKLLRKILGIAMKSTDIEAFREAVDFTNRGRIYRRKIGVSLSA